MVLSLITITPCSRRDGRFLFDNSKCDAADGLQAVIRHHYATCMSLHVPSRLQSLLILGLKFGFLVEPQAAGSNFLFLLSTMFPGNCNVLGLARMEE